MLALIIISIILLSMATIIGVLAAIGSESDDTKVAGLLVGLVNSFVTTTLGVILGSM